VDPPTERLQASSGAWTWSDGWTPGSSNTMSATAAGAEATLQFKGTGVAVLGDYTVNGGRAEVLLDNQKAGEINAKKVPNTNDNVYYNKAAFVNAPLNGFGNAPRTLGVYSPWRNNVDLSVSKQVRTGGGTALNVRLEVLNMFNIVQWAAPASSAFGNSSFGQITTQANNMRMVQFTLRFQF